MITSKKVWSKMAVAVNAPFFFNPSSFAPRETEELSLTKADLFVESNATCHLLGHDFP